MWISEAQAVAELTRLAGEADAATTLRYRHVNRIELSGDYVDTIAGAVIDRGSQLVSMQLTFEASSSEIAANLLGVDLAALDELFTDVVYDYSGDVGRGYMSMSTWDGQWLDLAAGLAAVEDEGLISVAAASIDDLTDPAIAIAGLEPTSFLYSHHQLAYNVPGDLVWSFLPNRIVTTLSDSGVDITSLELGRCPGYAYAVDGGFEVMVRTSDGLMNIDEIASLLGLGITMETYDTLYDFGTTEPVSLPDPSTIVTEVPGT